jgi:ribosomal protein L24E
MEYFQVPEANPGSDGLCSDNACPCGFPGATIPRGSGYMYVSDSVADFRKDARTVAEAEAKIARMRENTGTFVMFDQDVVTSTLMCEMGAKKRGLDLDVAGADAKYWWETGLVPLRATPKAGSAEAKKEKERMAAEAAPPKAEPAAPAESAPAQAPAAPAPAAPAAAPAKAKWWEFWK